MRKNGVSRVKKASVCVKNPPRFKEKMWGALKNAPQAGTLPPGVFVYTGAAVLLRGALLRPEWGTVFIRRPVLWRF